MGLQFCKSWITKAYVANLVENLELPQRLQELTKALGKSEQKNIHLDTEVKGLRQEISKLHKKVSELKEQLEDCKAGRDYTPQVGDVNEEEKEGNWRNPLR